MAFQGASAFLTASMTTSVGDQELNELGVP
jgi:hypothetical protein